MILTCSQSELTAELELLFDLVCLIAFLKIVLKPQSLQSKTSMKRKTRQTDKQEEEDKLKVTLGSVKRFERR
jgi:hypothetical protein